MFIILFCIFSQLLFPSFFIDIKILKCKLKESLNYFFVFVTFVIIKNLRYKSQPQSWAVDCVINIGKYNSKCIHYVLTVLACISKVLLDCFLMILVIDNIIIDA